VQRLRFEVFNLELGEGLDDSRREGLDRDEFDLVCDHLMVEDERTEDLVGTYRMQPASRGAADLYCAREFDLRGLPSAVLRDGIELGRAAVARGHRNGLALFALWRGLAAYATWRRARFLFGCSSLTSQDEALGWRVYAQLRGQGRLFSGVHVSPWPSFACVRPRPAGQSGAIALPRLFRTYLRYGARACGPPAIDRAFKTIDFLTLLDLEGLSPRLRGLFFEGLEAEVQA